MTFNLSKRINQVFSDYPEFTAAFYKEMEKQPDLCCPWHRKGQPGHKGNFGLMGECLDCMAEIEKGRCTVDMKNFDFDVYWTIRNFWLQVDIKGPNECWPWLGATKKNDTETVGYLPSPFHKGPTQSAARIAFWTSRGYVGKYRIQHQKGCDFKCCNPLHLRLSRLVSVPDPTEIESIQLNYGHFKADAKDEPGTAE